MVVILLIVTIVSGYLSAKILTSFGIGQSFINKCEGYGTGF